MMPPPPEGSAGGFQTAKWIHSEGAEVAAAADQRPTLGEDQPPQPAARRRQGPQLVRRDGLSKLQRVHQQGLGQCCQPVPPGSGGHTIITMITASAVGRLEWGWQRRWVHRRVQQPLRQVLRHNRPAGPAVQCPLPPPPRSPAATGRGGHPARRRFGKLGKPR